MADKISERDIRRAMVALQGFYDVTLEEMVGAVLLKEDSLHTGYLGNGETIVDRYGPLVLHLGNIIGSLHRAIARPAPPPTFGADTLTAPAAEIHDALNQWFLEHPKSQPVSVQVLPGDPDARAVIVYKLPGKAGRGGA